MKEAEEQAQTVHPSTHSRRLAGGPAVPSCSETQNAALSHAGLMEVTLQPLGAACARKCSTHRLHYHGLSSRI